MLIAGRHYCYLGWPGSESWQNSTTSVVLFSLSVLLSCCGTTNCFPQDDFREYYSSRSSFDATYLLHLKDWAAVCCHLWSATISDVVHLLVLTVFDLVELWTRWWEEFRREESPCTLIELWLACPPQRWNARCKAAKLEWNKIGWRILCWVYGRELYLVLASQERKRHST